MKLSEWKDIVQIFAIVAVGIFFIIKLFSGWFLVNLNINIETRRVHSISDQNKDYISFIAKLEKGEFGSLKIKKAEIKVKYSLRTDEKPKIYNLIGIERITYNSEKDSLDWNKKDDNPNLRIRPGESPQFSYWVTAPRDSACIIEITIVARRDYSFVYSQYRSSTVSLPLGNN